MKCYKPYQIENGQFVRCGTCPACRVQNKRDWTLRYTAECESYLSGGGFVLVGGLSYRDECLPENNEVNTYDFRAHIKRVRTLLKRKGIIIKENQIRYGYACEYGEKYGRPHYHAVYLCRISLKYKQAVWNALFEDWYKYHGFPKIENPRDLKACCSYLCGYVVKKLATRKETEEYYDERNSPRMVTSRGFGLSLISGLRAFTSQIAYNGKIRLLPNYLRKKLLARCYTEQQIKQLKRIWYEDSILTALKVCEFAIKKGVSPPKSKWKRTLTDLRSSDMYNYIIIDKKFYQKCYNKIYEGNFREFEARQRLFSSNQRKYNGIANERLHSQRIEDFA